jgi:hypothetical protein
MSIRRGKAKWSKAKVSPNRPSVRLPATKPKAKKPLSAWLAEAYPDIKSKPKPKRKAPPMTKKKDRDPLDIDDPGHPDFPPHEDPAHEGADVDLGMGLHAKKAKDAPSTHHTVNELMVEWWKLVKDSTPDPATVGDHFVKFAAEEGYQLTEIEPPPPPEEPAPE